MSGTQAPSGLQRLSNARAADRLHRIRAYKHRIALSEIGNGLLISAISLCLTLCTYQVFRSAEHWNAGGILLGIAIGATSLLLDASRQRLEAAQRRWNGQLNQELNVETGTKPLNLPPAAPTPAPAVPAAHPTSVAQLRDEIRFLTYLRLGAATVIGMLLSGVLIGLTVGFASENGPLFLLLAIVCGLLSIPSFRLRNSIHTERCELQEELSTLLSSNPQLPPQP